MAAFKILDLMVLLQPGWAEQTVGNPPGQTAPSVNPDACGVSNDPNACNTSLICQASQLVVNLDCVPLAELAVLKKQLAGTLEAIARREFELQPKMDSARVKTVSQAIAKLS